MNSIRVVYKDGVFHPLDPVKLPFGSRGLMTPDGNEIVDPEAKIRERYRQVIGLFPESVLEQMEADIEETCGKVDPDVWR